MKSNPAQNMDGAKDGCCTKLKTGPASAPAQPPASLEARANVLKAMAHPSRLVMLEELAKGERCVCELQKLCGADISTVSKHLAILKKSGLVEDERRGTWVYYRLLCPCLTSFLDCVDSVLAARSTPAGAWTPYGGAAAQDCE